MRVGRAGDEEIFLKVGRESKWKEGEGIKCKWEEGEGGKANKWKEGRRTEGKCELGGDMSRRIPTVFVYAEVMKEFLIQWFLDKIWCKLRFKLRRGLKLELQIKKYQAYSFQGLMNGNCLLRIYQESGWM